MASILIVDDEETILKVTSELLKYEGYEVHSALNVAHAMALLELNWIDLVLLDISMPRKDGTYLFSFIEENMPSVKIIVYSGYELESHPEKELIRKKADSFVCKGGKSSYLLKKIKQVLKS